MRYQSLVVVFGFMATLAIGAPAGSSELSHPLFRRKKIDSL